MSMGENATARWFHVLARVQQRWVKLESTLALLALLLEISALCWWIALKGLSSGPSVGSRAGLVFRAVVGGWLLGWLAHEICRRARRTPLREGQAAAVTGGLAVIGALLAPLWRSTGVDFFGNLLNWQQDASTLTLLGGLRGVASHLTVLLALLGASLATSSGEHIHIDVLARLLPSRGRAFANVLGLTAAMIVCTAASWGFFDYIAIQSFGVRAEATAVQKSLTVARVLRAHTFLLGSQLALDLRTFPHVMTGQRYDRWMTGAEWNDWVRDGGWERFYQPAEVESLLVTPSDASSLRSPLIVDPRGGDRGILARDLHLLFALGFLVLAFKLLVRVLLVLGGKVSLQPDGGHDDDLLREHVVEREPSS